MKRIVSFLLSLLMVVSMIPTAAFAEEAAPVQEIPASEEAILPEITEAPATPEVLPEVSEETDNPEVPDETEIPEILPETETAAETPPESLPEEILTYAQAPMSQAEFQALMEQFLAQEEDWLLLNKDLTVTSHLKVAMLMDVSENSCITVASGGTLELPCETGLLGTIHVKSGASLVVSQGSLLSLDGGKLQLDAGAALTIRGTLEIGEDSALALGKGVAVDCDGTVDILGDLTLASGCQVTNRGQFLVEEGGSLALEAGATLNNLGELQVEDGGTFRNDGTIFGELSQDAFIAALEAEGEGYVLTQSVTLTESMTIHTAFDIAAAGAITLGDGVTLTLNAPLELAGSITLGSGAVLNTADRGDLYILNDGLLLLESGAVMNAQSGLEVEAGGHLQIDQGATLTKTGALTLADGAIFTNNGTYNGGILGGNSYLSGAELQTWLDAAAQLGEEAYTLTIPAVISESTLLSGAKLCIGEGGSLTVRGGQTLSAGCDISVLPGGMLTVEQGGSLVCTGALQAEGGEILLESGCSVATENFGVIRVVSGKLINRGANFALEGITPYIEQYPSGTITNVAASMICFYQDIHSDRDISSALNRYSNYGSLRLYIRGSIELRGQITLPKNVVLYIRATELNTGSYTIAANSTLTVEGMVILEGAGAKLNVEKTGTLVNKGEIFIQDGGVLRIREEATLDNQGLVKVNEGGTLYGNGNLTGNEISGTVSQEDTSVLEELKEGLAQGSYTLTQRLVLTETMTFHNTVTIGQGGSLVIPRGVTLFFNNDGGIILDGGHLKVESGGVIQGGNYDSCYMTVNSGSLTVLSGGTLILNKTWAGFLRINGGTVTIYGGTTFSVSEVSVSLPSDAQITGIPKKDIFAGGTFSTMEELRQLIDLGSPYGQLSLSPKGDPREFTLESVTIPANTSLVFGNMYDEVRLGDGVLVENLGTMSFHHAPLRLLEGGKLLNKGLLDISDSTIRIRSGAELVNTGTIRAEAGTMFHIQEGGLLDNRKHFFHTPESSVYGEVTGNQPRQQIRDDVYHEFARVAEDPQAFAVALLEAQHSDADFQIYVRFPLEVTEELYIPYNVSLYFLGENAGLTVKSGATVTLGCISASFTGSDLTVENGGTLVTNHSVGIGSGGFLLALEGSTLVLGTNLYVDKGCALVEGTVTGAGKVTERDSESQTDPVIVTSSSQLVSELANAASWDDSYLIYIQSELTLDQSVTIPENATVYIRYPGSRLCLAEGVTLTNNGRLSLGLSASLTVSRDAALIGNSLISLSGCSTITVQEGGKLVVNMRIDQEKGCSITVYGTLDKENGMVEGTVFYPNEPEAMTQEQFHLLVTESNGSFALNRPLSLSGYTFPEGFRLTIAKGGKLTLSRSTTFSGELKVLRGGSLTISDFSKLESSGTITVRSGAALTLESYGSIQNQGKVQIYSGSTLSRGEYSNIGGNRPVYMGVDSDQGILAAEAIRPEDIVEGNGWYVDISGGSVEVTCFNQLYYAVQQAAQEGKQLNITVRSNLTVTRDLTLPDKVYLTISDCARLNIASGATLRSDYLTVNNAELRVKQGGKLDCDVWLRAENNALIYMEEGGTLTAADSIRLEDNAQLINRGTAEVSNLYLEAQSKGLTNYGSLTAQYLYVRSGAVLENQGTLTNTDSFRLEEEGAQFINQGQYLNNGFLHAYAGTVLKNKGTITNQGTLKLWVGATGSNTGKITGSGEIIDESGTLLNKDYAEFLNGVKSGWATVNKTITVTEDLFIDDAVIFIQEGGHLVIPDGVTVTYDLTSQDYDNCIRIYRGGQLTVEAGGCLVNNYNIHIMPGCTVDIQGTYRPGENGVLWAREGADIRGLTPDQLGLMAPVENAGDLYAALAQTGYRKRQLSINNSIYLTGSVTIDADTLLLMETYYQYINIQEGAVLTLEGDLNLRAGGIKVRSGGTLVINGTVSNEEYGMILVCDGGQITVNGRILGKEPVYEAGDGLPESDAITQAELKAMVSQSSFLSLSSSVTITENMTLKGLEWAEIAGNGSIPVITVAAGAELTLESFYMSLSSCRFIIEEGGKLKLVDAQIHLGEDSLLAIGGTLTAKDGELSVGNYGRLLVDTKNGMLNMEEPIRITGLSRIDGVSHDRLRLHNTAITGTRELKQYLAEFSDCRSLDLHISGAVTLTEDVTLPEHAYLQIDTWYGGKPVLTIAPGVTLTAEGEIEVQGAGAQLNVEGTLIKRGNRTSVWETGALTIHSGGTMINEATLQITENGTVTVLEGGTLENRDYIDTDRGGQLLVKGTFTGNPPGEMPEEWELEAGSLEELTAILEEATANIDRYHIWLVEDIAISQNLVIPSNANVYILSNLTVSEGASLTAEGELLVIGGQLNVEAGGKLISHRSLQVLEGGALWIKAGADLENRGLLLGDDISWLMVDGSFVNLGTLEGQIIPSDQRSVPVYSWQELQEALEGGAPLVQVMADMTISKNLTIHNTLRIPAGVTVTVKSGVTLNVQGTVAVYGTLKINGQTMGNRIESYGGTVTGPEGCWRTEGQLAQEIRFTCNTAMGLGMQQYVNAWVYPADAWDIGVTYEILEGSEYAALEDGLLTATGVGNVTIRATSADGNASADITIRILDYSVVIDESRSVTRLPEGGKGQIYAELVPGNLTDTEIVFSLAEGDEAYAKLTAKNGVATLTAKSLEEGHTVTVLAESKDGQALAAEWKVALVPKAQAVVILDAAGEPLASGATVTYDLRNEDNLATDCLIFDAATLPDSSLGDVTWSCSDTKGKLVTTVDLSTPNRISLAGFTGKTGTITLTAAANDGSGKKATLKLKLVALPQNIALADPAADWLLAGKTMNLKALDQDTGAAISSGNLRWSLAREADAAFVTLTASGKLTARKIARQQTVEILGCVVGNEDIARVSHLVTVYPAATKVSILHSPEEIYTEDITGRTICLEAGAEDFELDSWVYPGGELGAKPDVTWKSSNNSIATVDSQGTVSSTGKSGTVTITCTAADGSGKKATVKLKYGIMTQDIQLFLGKEPFHNVETALTLRSGQNVTLTAKTLPEKPTTKGVTFFLEDPADSAYLTVSTSGKLSAKTVFDCREVRLVAMSKDGGCSEIITVRLLPKEERLLVLQDPAYNNLTRATKVLQSGDIYRLSAQVLDSSDPENITLEDAQVSWRSSNERIARLVETPEGILVEMLRPGSATITAQTEDGMRTTVTFRAVERLADSIVITEKSGSQSLAVASGKSITLAAQVLDRAGNPASNKNVTWEVLWGEAKISSSGKLTATAGLADLSVALVAATAKDGSGVVATANVVILPLAQSISILREGTEVTNLTLTLAVGDTLDLDALTYPLVDIPEAEALRAVTWKSSGKKAVQIDAATGELTCLAPGTATITCAAADGSGKKATVKIQVLAE